MAQIMRIGESGLFRVVGLLLRSLLKDFVLLNEEHTEKGRWSRWRLEVVCAGGEEIQNAVNHRGFIRCLYVADFV